MKPVTHRGFALIELMGYLAVLAIILTLAMTAYGRFASQSGRLQRAAADIIAALNAGETWRADIRQSTSAVEVTSDRAGVHRWAVPHRDGKIIYTFENGRITRSAPKGPTVVLVNNVKTTQLAKDVRQHASGWRWELELKSQEQKPKVRPYFCFLAVPGSRPR